jgi:hypothetical protein
VLDHINSFVKSFDSLACWDSWEERRRLGNAEKSLGKR